MEFCSQCDNLLILNTENTKELSNVCLNCGNKQAVKGSTMIYEESFNVERNKENLLRYACDIITIPRKMEYCPSCKKNEIVSVIRQSKTLKYIHICCKCRNYF
jgi:DNA-directed RNA polymerase subunit M/transcription elongation factor TFIIS